MHDRSPTTRALVLSEKLDAWLHTCGLAYSPFDTRYLDAGADPQLSSYVVGHQFFNRIWKDQSSAIFAPVGGGKSAFRVRLAHACRVGQDGRRILPVVYKLPDPARFQEPGKALETHFRFLAQSIAAELLLLLLYRPERFSALDAGDRRAVAAMLHHLPINPRFLLQQIRNAGTIQPLLAPYDPTAGQLPAQASRQTIADLCTQLLSLVEQTRTPAVRRAGAAYAHFSELAGIAVSLLRCEAVYLLVDGVDAYSTTTTSHQRAVEMIEPLLREAALHEAPIFTKYFLPEELAARLTMRRMLPYGSAVDISLIDIYWTRELLLELLAARLRFASHGQFDSLDAISSPALRGVHEELVDAVAASPRELLVLANRLLLAHVLRPAGADRLEPGDWAYAQISYQQERSP